MDHIFRTDTFEHAAEVKEPTGRANFDTLPTSFDSGLTNVR